MMVFKKRALNKKTGKTHAFYCTNPTKGTITICSVDDDTFADGYDHTYFKLECPREDFEIVDVVDWEGEE